MQGLINPLFIQNLNTTNNTNGVEGIVPGKTALNAEQVIAEQLVKEGKPSPFEQVLQKQVTKKSVKGEGIDEIVANVMNAKGEQKVVIPVGNASVQSPKANQSQATLLKNLQVNNAVAGKDQEKAIDNILTSNSKAAPTPTKNLSKKQIEEQYWKERKSIFDLTPKTNPNSKKAMIPGKSLNQMQSTNKSLNTNQLEQTMQKIMQTEGVRNANRPEMITASQLRGQGSPKAILNEIKAQSLANGHPRFQTNEMLVGKQRMAVPQKFASKNGINEYSKKIIKNMVRPQTQMINPTSSQVNDFKSLNKGNQMLNNGQLNQADLMMDTSDNVMFFDQAIKPMAQAGRTFQPNNVLAGQMPMAANNQAEQVIEQIHNYIESAKIANKDQVQFEVRHNDIGKFKIDVTKRANDVMEISIAPETRVGKDFFTQNQTRLIESLSNSGVKVSDLRLDNSMVPNRNMQGQNDFSERDQSGLNQQSRQGQQDSAQRDSQRRRELWELFQQSKVA